MRARGGKKEGTGDGSFDTPTISSVHDRTRLDREQPQDLSVWWVDCRNCGRKKGREQERPRKSAGRGAWTQRSNNQQRQPQQQQQQQPAVTPATAAATAVTATV